MEIELNEKQKAREEDLDMEIVYVERLLSEYDEFFNFVNLNDNWYRWVSGNYSVTNVDSMGETLFRYVEKFCRDEHILKDKELSSTRLLLMNYKGVNFLFRKLDGKKEFSAVSIVENPTSVRMIYWNNFTRYLEKEMRQLNSNLVDEN